MQLYLTPRHNANAFASTFLFFATHNATSEKIKKSLQANAHSTTEKNNEPLTAPTINWRFSTPQTHFWLIKHWFSA